MSTNPHTSFNLNFVLGVSGIDPHMWRTQLSCEVHVRFPQLRYSPSGLTPTIIIQWFSSTSCPARGPVISINRYSQPTYVSSVTPQTTLMYPC
ncbi:uncharacterized protein LACBIDRAFT_308069 [Laccaria bicolor S238N-H82]|uniref:Predicted protein n=1 Tax=Laccaria bicolor (strain S238N-H82 / ATCC MYA-4686) TaxID=486041 RepID=B0DRK3_LACBS|nr:uncharacterized protein LACBIDRAFT_308069 [Laccaria bicolor S238N-H82]EDR02799.1 predicted protein [Laccaria bicolor S238N-H82]|eukprot:XP_001886509.1 predicted protein [Laccaria bicolor S238N-H82]